MPTQKQRDALNDICKSLVKLSEISIGAAETSKLLNDRLLRLRIIPGEISSAGIGALRQNLSKLCDELSECVSEAEIAEEIARSEL